MYRQTEKVYAFKSSLGISYFLEFLEMILFVQATFIQISLSLHTCHMAPNEYCVRSGSLSPYHSAWLHWFGVCFLFAVSGKCVTSTPQRRPFPTLTFDPGLFVGSQNPCGISFRNTFAAQIQTLQDIGQTPLTGIITFLLSYSFRLFLFSPFSLCSQFSCFPVCLLHCYFGLPVSYRHNKENNMMKYKIISHLTIHLTIP